MSVTGHKQNTGGADLAGEELALHDALQVSAFQGPCGNMQEFKSEITKHGKKVGPRCRKCGGKRRHGIISDADNKKLDFARFPPVP